MATIGNRRPFWAKGGQPWRHNPRDVMPEITVLRVGARAKPMDGDVSKRRMLQSGSNLVGTPPPEILFQSERLPESLLQLFLQVALFPEHFATDAVQSMFTIVKLATLPKNKQDRGLTPRQKTYWGDATLGMTIKMCGTMGKQGKTERLADITERLKAAGFRWDGVVRPMPVLEDILAKKTDLDPNFASLMRRRLFERNGDVTVIAEDLGSFAKARAGGNPGPWCYDPTRTGGLWEELGKTGQNLMACAAVMGPSLRPCDRDGLVPIARDATPEDVRHLFENMMKKLIKKRLSLEKATDKVWRVWVAATIHYRHAGVLTAARKLMRVIVSNTAGNSDDFSRRVCLLQDCLGYIRDKTQWCENKAASKKATRKRAAAEEDDSPTTEPPKKKVEAGAA